MNIVILGAGVAGVSSAYFLRKLGHRVTVIDRQPAVALEGSRAVGGQLSFGAVAPWASPALPWAAGRWLLRQQRAPVAGRWGAAAASWRWFWALFQHCRRAPYQRNHDDLLRLADYSQALFEQLDREEALRFDQQPCGSLQIFRQLRSISEAEIFMDLLNDYDIPFELLTPSQCQAREPTLPPNKIAGAIYLPRDWRGSCYLFSQQLAERARTRGVEFIFGRSVSGLETRKGKVVAVQVGAERFLGDVFLVCLGAGTRPLLATAGLNAPLLTVKSYSLTLPISDWKLVPQLNIIDPDYQVAISRIGGQLRVSGFAGLGEGDYDSRARNLLEWVLRDLNPQGADSYQGHLNGGHYALTPSQVPLVGGTRWVNLFVNAGHGHWGWPLSLGSARLVADLIHGYETDIPWPEKVPALL